MTDKLDAADRIRTDIYRILQGDYPDEPKTLLLVAYLDLALEHHNAIMLLLRQRLFGSAFALVRLVFEILFVSHWVNVCAKPAEIEKIAYKGTLEFPPMGQIVTDVDKAYGTGDFFADLKKRGWKAMNAYTHSGLLQLGRRFSGTKVAPTYKDEAILEVVKSTTTAVLLIANVLAKSTGKTAAAAEVEKLFNQVP